MTDHLIRDDTPLPAGTKVELRVTSTYVITLDDDLLEGAETMTLAEIRQVFGKYMGDQIRDVERNYERDDADADWYLPNNLGADYRTFRFDRGRDERGYATRDRYVELAEVLA